MPGRGEPEGFVPMSAQILLLNPRHKKRRRKTNRRSRKGRMPAGLRRYWASRRGTNPRRRRRRHSNRRRVMRVGRHYRARSINPRRRRRTNRRRMGRRVHARVRRYGRRAFASITGRGIVGQYIVPAGLGGVGALGLDIAWGYAAPHLPAQLQTGWLSLAAKSALVIGGVMLVGRFLPRYRQKVQVAGVGAITVLAANAIKGAAQGILPATTPGLSGYIDYQSYALPGARAGGMHGYMPRTLGSLEDLYSPAAVIQPSGTAVPRQFGGFAGYVAVQPHVMGNGGLMGYEWNNDGM